MIKFFRKTRYNQMEKNKTGKYFRYAIGEIVLVVIGILIALQINNWNTERQNNSRIQHYALNLAEDLKKDIGQTKIRIRQIEKQISYIDTTANYVRGKGIEEISNIDAIYEFNAYYGYRPFNWFTATIEEIKNSGSLNLIKNDSLRQKIIAYYAFTRHLDDDYNGDDQLADKLNSLQSNIINSNYPRSMHLYDSLRLYYNRPKTDWLQSETYQNAKALNFKLLTEDINDFHVLVNFLFRYKGSLNIRAENEFLALIEDAEDIIQIIQQDYKK